MMYYGVSFGVTTGEDGDDDVDVEENDDCNGK